MPKFAAIHNFGPGLGEMLAEQGADMIAWLQQVYPQIVWDGMYADWESGKVVCLWEAPDVESVISHLEETETPYEDVFPVEWVTPHDLATET